MFNQIAANTERYMDLLSIRQKLIASNIANADTPGYKTRDIDFQFEFLSRIGDEKPNVVEVSGLTAKNDGNNVNIDREMRMLSETAMRFSMASVMARGEIRGIRSAIQEGRAG